MRSTSSSAYWQGKVALITGGSAGLGLALGRALSVAGAQTVLAARHEAALQQAAEQLRALGSDSFAVPADVTSGPDVDRLVQAAIDRFGRLDMLVNCAGRSARGAVLTTTAVQFRELWELNFLSAVRCTQAAAPHLLKTRGHLVNIGSLSSKLASRYLGGYPSSKFALAAYSQQLRLELAAEGLHVLLVCPGPLRRADAGQRYQAEAQGLPQAAQRPGGGVRLRGLDADWLAQRILRACRSRQAELVVPRSARLLAAIAQLWPQLGDWIIRRMT